MKPHPDEVDAVKWVSLEEMDAMMDNQGMYFSSPAQCSKCVQTPL